MGLFDRFRGGGSGTLPPGAFDPELLRRLSKISAAQATLLKGVSPKQLGLAICTDAEGNVSDDRPKVGLKLLPLGRQGDVWSFEGRVDDPTAYLRFLLDLEVPDQPPVTAEQLDANALPGVGFRFRRHPEYEHGELARSACLMAWRAETDQGFLSERRAEPLTSMGVAMGTSLMRSDVAYVMPGGGSWLLLKCEEPGPFFVAVDVQTLEAEMFPRRFDEQGYAFALDLLRTVA